LPVHLVNDKGRSASIPFYSVLPDDKVCCRLRRRRSLRRRPHLRADCPPPGEWSFFRHRSAVAPVKSQSRQLDVKRPLLTCGYRLGHCACYRRLNRPFQDQRSPALSAFRNQFLLKLALMGFGPPAGPRIPFRGESTRIPFRGESILPGAEFHVSPTFANRTPPLQ
jgi:hypothetical protein